MVNCSSSFGLFIICVALDLPLAMKVEKDSFGSCLVVSKSLLVLVLVVKLPTNVFPVSSSIVFKIEEPFESSSSQGVLEHLCQHFFSSSQGLHSPHVHL